MNRTKTRFIAVLFLTTMIMFLHCPNMRAEEPRGRFSMPRQMSDVFDLDARRFLTLREVFGEGNTAKLVEALVREDAEAAKVWLERGADLNARGKRGLTPLHYLVGNEHLGGTRIALELGADPNLISDGGDTPLAYAVDCNPEANFIKLLVESKANIALASRYKRLKNGFPIMISVVLDIAMADLTPNRHFDEELLWWLLDHGGDINEQDSGGETLLTRCHAARLAYELLNRGANPYILNIHGQDFYDEMDTDPKKPFDAEEKLWLEKLYDQAELIRGCEVLIQDAKETNKHFQEFRVEYDQREKARIGKGAREDLDALKKALDRIIKQREANESN